jgi:peptidoglycan/LPS O-acetylase OafA/YrhL
MEFLDGLRALAALWVVLGHARLFALGWDAVKNDPTAPFLSQLLVPLLNFPLYMHQAVDIFLVLSGFCLMQSVGDRKLDLVKFLGARARRILPPYYGALAILLIINIWLPIVSWARHPIGLTEEIPAAVWWTNLLLLQDTFSHLNTINGPFWSVAAEWHLYWVFPLLLLCLRRWGVLALLAVAGVAAAVLTAVQLRYMNFPFFGTVINIPRPTHFVFLFASGMAAAAVVRRNWPLWPWGVVLAAVLAWLLAKYPITDIKSMFKQMELDYVFDSVAGGLTAVCIAGLARASESQPARWLLERSPFVWMAGFSYSLYLVHAPVLASLHYVLNDNRWYGLDAVKNFGLLLLTGIPASLLVAWVFSKLFERKFSWPANWPAGRRVVALPQPHGHSNWI